MFLILQTAGMDWNTGRILQLQYTYNCSLSLLAHGGGTGSRAVGVPNLVPGVPSRLSFARRTQLPGAAAMDYDYNLTHMLLCFS